MLSHKSPIIPSYLFGYVLNIYYTAINNSYAAYDGNINLN